MIQGTSQLHLLRQNARSEASYADSSTHQQESGRLKSEDEDYFETLFSVPTENQVGEKPQRAEGKYVTATVAWFESFSGGESMFQLSQKPRKGV